MPERVKRMKCGGGGRENNLKVGGYAGEGAEDKMQGGGGVAEKIEGGMPERVKKTKCGGGGLREKFEGGVCRRG